MEEINEMEEHNQYSTDSGWSSGEEYNPIVIMDDEDDELFALQGKTNIFLLEILDILGLTKIDGQACSVM